MSETTTEQLNKKIPRVWNRTISRMMYIQIKTFIESQYLYKHIKVKPNDSNTYFGCVELVAKEIDFSLLRDLDKIGYWNCDIKAYGDTLHVFARMEFETFRRRYLEDDLL